MSLAYSWSRRSLHSIQAYGSFLSLHKTASHWSTDKLPCFLLTFGPRSPMGPSPPHFPVSPFDPVTPVSPLGPRRPLGPYRMRRVYIENMFRMVLLVTNSEAFWPLFSDSATKAFFTLDKVANTDYDVEISSTFTVGITLGPRSPSSPFSPLVPLGPYDVIMHT